MNRRSFLTLPALLPFRAISSALRSQENHFAYEGILGTSLDLTVWTPHSSAAERACRIALEEIDRLASILNTRVPTSEISLFENSNFGGNISRELREVLTAYDYWERTTDGIFSIRPGGRSAPR